MKKTFFSFLAILISGIAMAQKSCCMKPNATETFAMLSEDRNFVLSHLDPLPYKLKEESGTMISFKTTDGKEGYAYEIKAKTKANKYIFIIHEWWGLNDYIKKESERIYTELKDVNVIALDLYDKKVATTRDSAGKYMNEVKMVRAEAIIKGALAYAGKNAEIATIGWCFGGGWSMQASIIAGKQSKACVMYYGMPEENSSQLKKLNAPVLFIWPQQDKWINKEVVEKMKVNMNKSNKSVEVISYNADHAFANPSNPKYSKEFADDAFNHSMKFITDNLK